MTKRSLPPRGTLSRFYDQVSLGEKEDGFTLLLDQREAKTPLRHALLMPTRALADAVLGEWTEQDTNIDFARMPFTRLLTNLRDKAVTERASWCVTIINFLCTDLLCYRASQPTRLVQRQDAVWSAYLDWAARRFGIVLETTTGIMAIEQPEDAIETLRLLLQQRSDAEIFALSSATELLGSAILGLAFWADHTVPEELFMASYLDEDFQTEQWGEEGEAMQKRTNLQATFQELAAFWRLYKTC